MTSSQKRLAGVSATPRYKIAANSLKNSYFCKTRWNSRCKKFGATYVLFYLGAIIVF